MNKTFNVNLGGYSLVIDEDAYETAQHYLTTLARHFGGSEGAAEIMQDIENRMGELIQRNKSTRTIVSKMDVLEAIAVLGTPEELKDVDFSNVDKTGQAHTDNSFQLKTGKRLYRDEDDKVIGGVCSGLAAYFGIQDVVWVRIAFILLGVMFGTSVVVYLILWAIIPAAKTVSERLEMMGEPTNVNNIARMVKQEVEEFSDKIHDKWNRKKNKHHPHYQGPKEPPKSSGISLNMQSWMEQKQPPPYKSKDFV